MLIPDSDGHFLYHDIRVIEYRAFVDSQLRIVEIFTTEEGERLVLKNKWEDLNDIEKYVALERGWDIPAGREREKTEETHEAEVIPFPLSF